MLIKVGFNKRMSGNHSGHRKRLKDKIERFGFESLYPHEMLEYILFASIPRKNTNDIAHRLIDTFGSYENVFKQKRENLLLVEGVGPSSVLQILSYAHHVSNFKHENVQGVAESPMKIKNLGDARRFFFEYFNGKKNEEFHVVLLDKSGKPIAHEIFCDGKNDSVSVSAGSVLRIIQGYMPHYVLLAHNHPSGNVNPSQKDIDFTNNIWKIIESIGITNHEHFIFSGAECYSFRNNGILESLQIKN